MNPIDYFESCGHMYTFALCYMECQPRADILGINDGLYNDDKLATTWYNYIKQNIESVDCGQDTELALSQLDRLYINMTEDEDD